MEYKEIVKKLKEKGFGIMEKIDEGVDIVEVYQDDERKLVTDDLDELEEFLEEQ